VFLFDIIIYNNANACQGPPAPRLPKILHFWWTVATLLHRQGLKRAATYARSRDHCCCVKATSFTYSECAFIDLVTQHAMCMRRIMSSVACLTVPYFSTWSHKRHDIRKKLTEYNTCVWFSLKCLSELRVFPIVRRIQRSTICHKLRGYSCKVPDIIVGFQWNFSKTFKCQVSWKFFYWEPSYSMGTDWQTDKQTDLTKLLFVFWNYSNALKMVDLIPRTLCSAMFEKPLGLCSASVLSNIKWPSVAWDSTILAWGLRWKKWYWNRFFSASPDP